MKYKKHFAIFVVVILFFVSFGFYLENEKSTTVTIARVMDGDTVELANGKRIRLLGIDAPEKGKFFYYSSKNKLEELIEGKRVSLEKDVTNKDSFGRLLRYIFIDDVFVNEEMVRSGYATVYIVNPDTKYSDRLLEAEDEARTSKSGVWKYRSYGS